MCSLSFVLFASLRFGLVSFWFQFRFRFGFGFQFWFRWLGFVIGNGNGNGDGEAMTMASVVPDASPMLTPMPSTTSPSGHAPFSVFSFSTIFAIAFCVAFFVVVAFVALSAFSYFLAAAVRKIRGVICSLIVQQGARRGRGGGGPHHKTNRAMGKFRASLLSMPFPPLIYQQLLVDVVLAVVFVVGIWQTVRMRDAAMRSSISHKQTD